MNMFKKLYVGAIMLATSAMCWAQEVSEETDLTVPPDAIEAMNNLKEGAKNWVTEGVKFMAGLAIVGLAIYFLPRVIGWFKKMLGRLG